MLIVSASTNSYFPLPLILIFENLLTSTNITNCNNRIFINKKTIEF